MGSQVTAMDISIRILMGLIMAAILVAKMEVAALPQYPGQVDSMDPMGMEEEGMQMDKRKGFDSMSGFTFGKKKRNFDEIDRAGFGAFVKRSPSGYSKKNFDEIDRAGLGAFVKRFPSKRNFDEIDRAGFGAFVKRNFDEIDKVGFGSFNRQF